MATSLRLEEGGIVTLSAGPEEYGRRPMRLEVFGRGEPRGATVFLWPGEARELVVELLHRLKGGDDVARLPIALGNGRDAIAISLDRLVDLVCGETVAPAAAAGAPFCERCGHDRGCPGHPDAGAVGEKGGEPT